MGTKEQYDKLLEAEAAWIKELIRVYEKDADAARYDERGYATERLKELSAAYIFASGRYTGNW